MAGWSLMARRRTTLDDLIYAALDGLTKRYLRAVKKRRRRGQPLHLAAVEGADDVSEQVMGVRAVRALRDVQRKRKQSVRPPRVKAAPPTPSDPDAERIAELKAMFDRP
jgi:hypothetical protein